VDSNLLPGSAGGRWAFLARMRWQRTVTIVLLVGFALHFLWQVRDILPPFLIAFFLAALLDPVVSNLQKKGLSRVKAVASIYLLVLLFLVLAILWVGPMAFRQMRDLAESTSNLTGQLTTTADAWYAENHKILHALGMKEKPSVFLSDRSGPVAEAARGVLDTIKTTLIRIAGQVLWILIIPLSLFYFLMDYQRMRAKIISFVPAKQRSHVDKVSQEVVEIFSDYVRGLSKVCALYGCAFIGIFYLLGLRYALFLGITAGFMYAVPYVGPALTFSSATLIALTMGQTTGYVVLVVALCLVTHITFDYVITPRIVGGSVGLHPVLNIFALMAGATIWGVWGMLLAVPVAASIQMTLIYFFPKLAEKPEMIASDRLSDTQDRGDVPAPPEPERAAMIIKEQG
jgi:predicted PurR-regulated permease PerM